MPRRRGKYYLEDASYLPEMIATPNGTTYLTDELGNPAISLGALRDTGDNPKVYSNKELSNNQPTYGITNKQASRWADLVAGATAPGIGDLLMAGIGKPMNLTSPSHWWGAVRDWDTEKGWRNIWEDNSGVLSKKYSEEHPWQALGANFLTDILAGNVINKAKKVYSLTRNRLSNSLDGYALRDYISPGTIRNATDTGLNLQIASDKYRNSKTIYSLLYKRHKGKPLTDEERIIANQAKDLLSFFKSKQYKERLSQYYKDLYPGSLYNAERIDDTVWDLIDNVGQAKVNTYKDGFLWSNGGITDNALGVYSTKDHIISILKRALRGSTPKHEMIHASDRGKAFLDNKKYAMRVKEGNPERGYYVDIAEQRPRVINTLSNMDKKGYDINNLTQADVDSYFDFPIDELPTEAQSLFDNYEYDDILNALRNFKSVLPYVTLGGGAATIANTYKHGGKIYIKPKNRGKFNALKKRTGKTTEELTHSKNPLTRKRAIFAQNAAKWKH